MSDHEPTESERPAPAGMFPATRWTTLLKPIADRQADEREALQRLFEVYRAPIVAFIRAREPDRHAAEDLAHDFIMRLLERDDLARLDRARGRFRTFLCVALRRFLARHHEWTGAQKRGARAEHLPLEPDDDLVPVPPSIETEFVRRWFEAAQEEVIRRLRREWTIGGKGAEFPDYEPYLWDRQAEGRRDELARKYGLTLNALNVRISRLRERQRAVMRDVIGETVGGPGEVDEEIRFLMAHLSG